MILSKSFLRSSIPFIERSSSDKNIIQFKQETSEPFWKYFERFKDLLAQCPHHGIEKSRQCQILYDGLDYQTKTLLETMCQGEFLKKDEDQCWDLYEALAGKPFSRSLALRKLTPQLSEPVCIQLNPL